MVAWGEVTNGEKQYKLHAGQSTIMRSKARFIAALAGTGGGKTVLGPLWLMAEIAKHPNQAWMVLAPTFSILKRATVPTLIETFKGTDLEGEYVQGLYRLPDGGVIWCLSTDNPQGIEGGQIAGAWVDEGGQISYTAWVALQGRVGQKQGRVLITTTLYNLGWLKREFFSRYLAGDPDYFCHSWCSAVNPAYPQEEVERQRRELSPHRFSMRYLGVFAAPEGLVYPDFEHCIVPPMDVLPAGRLVGGMDFGFSGPFCALAGVLYVDENSPEGGTHLHIFYYRYLSRLLLSVHSSHLPRGVTWYADPSRPGSIKELRLAGHTMRAATNDIVLGIDAVTKRMRTRTLTISSVCKPLIAELQEYCYPEGGGEKPVDEFDHAVDSLRYLIMGIDKRRIASAA